MKAEEAPTFVAAVRRLTEILAKKDHAALEKSGFLDPSTAAEYLTALNDYLSGQSVTAIPEAVLKNIELYPTKQEGRFRADVDLWVDGNRSDLTAVVYFDKQTSSPNQFELYDLRVL
ncbi:hypothetical protein [Massilia sp. YMA4]|uniref:DUF7668 domain-containing protein n=1 Tax=[Empedobacter] haloabium TaxID=592317 RepID=A0ABZ1URS4_9BURK|nr:hypothetical protein [Massilia sp. YMA4]AXA91308.1 hypothetical protein DPH57_09180 [Massilia sp. YMA4]